MAPPMRRAQDGGALLAAGLRAVLAESAGRRPPRGGRPGRRRRARRGARRAERLPAQPGDDGGAVLPRSGAGAGRHHRGAPGRRSRWCCRWSTPTAGRSRGAGRRLALRRRRQLLGLRAAGQRPGRATPAARPSCAAPSSPTRAGWSRFETIWPGWYRGRTPHVHYRVFLDERDAADQPAVLPRRRQRGGVPRPRLPRAGRGAGHDQRHRRHRAARRTRAYARVAQAGGGWRAELVVGVAPA